MQRPSYAAIILHMQLSFCICSYHSAYAAIILHMQRPSYAAIILHMQRPSYAANLLHMQRPSYTDQTVVIYYIIFQNNLTIDKQNTFQNIRPVSNMACF
jgi:hypothetical protein